MAMEDMRFTLNGPGGETAITNMKCKQVHDKALQLTSSVVQEDVCAYGCMSDTACKECKVRKRPGHAARCVLKPNAM